MTRTVLILAAVLAFATGAGAQSPRPPACVTSGYQLVAINASPADHPTTSSHGSDLTAMNKLINQASLESGGSGASLRFACAGKNIRVDQVVLPTLQAAATIGTIRADLTALGYNRPSEKYVVWYQDRDYLLNHTGICGIGQNHADDRASVDNLNNQGGTFAVDFGCGWKSMLHELAHTLGAVQNSAPHATGLGHCWDTLSGNDVMCYDDGGPTLPNPPVFTACTQAVGKAFFFDCGHDDYYAVKPAAGSYLASHWNLAACYVRFITQGGCP